MVEMQEKIKQEVEADKEKVAKVVLMPGDPLRAKYIAETYLENPELFNSGSAQGSFRKNSNDSWISDRVIVAVCFRSPFLNPQEYMRK